MSAKSTTSAAAQRAATETVSTALQRYANRGIFRGFGGGTEQGSRTTYKVVWHWDHTFDLILDTKKKTVRFPVVLPNVPAGSEMHEDYKRFVKRRLTQSPDGVSRHVRLDEYRPIA